MTTPLLLAALVPLLQTAPAESHTRTPAMTTGSWVFMLVAWVFVTALLAWSFKRVLSEPGKPAEPPIAGPPGG